MASPRARRFLPVLALIALAACGGGDGDGGGGGNCLAGPGPNYGAFAQNPTAAETQLAADVVTLVNNERAAAALNPVVAEAPIAKMAFDYSVDMQMRGFFDHVNLECEGLDVRLARAGIPYVLAAENIAQGQVSAADVMQAWMNSPAHRANILNGQLTKIGVGAVQAGGTTTWTQVFTRTVP
jgi:uncharacterized protein YkwD